MQVPIRSEIIMAEAPSVRLQPVWPGRPYTLVCPAGTPPSTCAKLASTPGQPIACHEPERDTEEVLNSFLVGCGERTDGCLYVDVGCNIGYFAAQANAHGAAVECFEPTPLFTDAISRTIGLMARRASWRVHNVAVTHGQPPPGATLTFKGQAARNTYTACSIGRTQLLKRASAGWTVPVVGLRSALRGRRVTLLKIDIDATEGLMVHDVVTMLAQNEAAVETILVELGDYAGGEAWCGGGADLVTRTPWLCKSSLSSGAAARHEPPGAASSPRGSEVADLWALQRLGYDAYRLNILVGREIYDWRGVNRNGRMAPLHPLVTPMYGVRSMRRLEKLPHNLSRRQYSDLLRWGTSLLITKVQLADVAKHHTIDLDVRHANLTARGHSETDPLAALNEGNPANPVSNRREAEGPSSPLPPAMPWPSR